jgi:hypothetical protein
MSHTSQRKGHSLFCLLPSRFFVSPSLPACVSSRRSFSPPMPLGCLARKYLPGSGSLPPSPCDPTSLSLSLPLFFFLSLSSFIPSSIVVGTSLVLSLSPVHLSLSLSLSLAPLLSLPPGAHPLSYIYTYIYICIHTYIHIYIYTYIRTCTCIHILKAEGVTRRHMPQVHYFTDRQ